jgi:exodeoxyribonuclease VII large subunit
MIPDPDSAAPRRDIYSVSRLAREAKLLLEGSFPPIWIEGELSNLARPASGHIYFSIKDAQAQIRCAFFRQYQRQSAGGLREGTHVLMRARVSLYEGRGDFQLLVDYVEEAGEGALRRALELLRQRLQAEGLFDSARKRALPRLPRRIGLVTSPSGAVLHDILTTLRRRFPAIGVVLYPVPVQGEGAAEKIAAAIRLAGARAECDALIVARGGGSLEDLRAFNEEIVVRAICAAPIPVVSAVGHETDFTLADFAADSRAPTPTAAAEMLSPDRSEWLAALRTQRVRLLRIMQDRIRARSQHLDWLTARLVHPRARLEQIRLRLQGLAPRLAPACHARVHALAAHLRELRARLVEHSPRAPIADLLAFTERTDLRLRHGVHSAIERSRARLAGSASALQALSPLATLARGYAVVQTADGRVLRDARIVRPGDSVDVRLAQGHLGCRVEKVRAD